MNQKLTIPIFDITTYSEHKTILNSTQKNDRDDIIHVQIDSQYICHDNLFVNDIIEIEKIEPNSEDIFLIKINKDIYLRKIVISTDLYRLEPILESAKDHVIVIDRKIQQFEILGKFRKKILLLSQIINTEA